MIESTIKDYKEEVIGQFEKLNISVMGREDLAFSNELNEIRDMINKNNPSLMFYGIYNAGKSSVLNAIFGSNVASVRDVPETHKVTSYKWRNFTLVDTPGLNAPVDGDEEITLDEIRKHDIIMFVIDDSDNFDSKEITIRIVEILKSGKPCIVVINRKNQGDKELVMTIKTKMDKNIEQYSDCKYDYDFIDIDADEAIKAKNEDKQLLLVDSNILELENCISQKLSFIEKTGMLRVPLENMNTLCSRILNIIEQQESNEKAKKLQELLEELIHIRGNSLISFKRKLGEKIAIYIETIYVQMSNGNKGEINQSQCEDEITALVNEEIENFCKSINARNQELVQKWRLELNVQGVNSNHEIQTGDKREAKDSIDELLDIIEKIPIVIPVPLPQPVPIPLPLIVQVVKMIKKFIFGSGQNSVDIEEANEKNREAARSRMFALKELKNQITIQLEGYAQKIESNFVQVLDECYEMRKKELDRLLVEQENNSKMNIELMNTVNEIKVRNEMLLEKLRC